MASMRVTAKRAKGEYYTYVRSNRSGQRTTRHHWPIFVFTGAVKENLHAVVRGNAACEYV